MLIAGHGLYRVMAPGKVAEAIIDGNVVPYFDGAPALALWSTVVIALLLVACSLWSYLAGT